MSMEQENSTLKQQLAEWDTVVAQSGLINFEYVDLHCVCAPCYRAYLKQPVSISFT